MCQHCEKILAQKEEVGVAILDKELEMRGNGKQTWLEVVIFGHDDTLVDIHFPINFCPVCGFSLASPTRQQNAMWTDRRKGVD